MYAYTMSRTNIDLDAHKVEQVMHIYNLRTKREAVDLALTRLVDSMTSEEMLDMQGSGWRGDFSDIRSEDKLGDFDSD